MTRMKGHSDVSHPPLRVPAARRLQALPESPSRRSLCRVPSGGVARDCRLARPDEVHAAAADRGDALQVPEAVRYASVAPVSRDGSELSPQAVDDQPYDGSMARHTR